jgi:hypothetical protein
MKTIRWLGVVFFTHALTADAAPFDAIQGTWSGAVQFTVSSRTDFHSVGKFALFVQPDGSVQGQHANGCKFAGLAMRGITDQLFNLNVTAKGCAPTIYNRRWSGRLVIKPKEKVVDFALQASDAIDRKFSALDAQGTLTRP